MLHPISGFSSVFCFITSKEAFLQAPVGELMSGLLHWVRLRGQECAARTADRKGFRMAEELSAVNPAADTGLIHVGKVFENQTSKRAAVTRGWPMGIQNIGNLVSLQPRRALGVIRMMGHG